MPSHPVKWFSSAMPGAPLLRNIAGDLIAVLDWCLVNGSATTAVQSIVVAGDVATVTFASAHTFQKHQIIEIAGVTGTLSALNSQWRATGVTSLALTFAATGIANGTAAGTITCKTPGVGWQKAFSGTNKAAYRSQDVTGTRFYFRLDDTQTTTATASGYEAMTDVDTGSNQFAPTPATISKPSTSSARPWWVVGDGKTWFYCAANAGQGGTNAVVGAGFGDLDDFASASTYGCFLACSGTKGIVSTGGGGPSVCARSYTGTLGAVSIDRVDPPGHSGGYPSPVDEGFRLAGPVVIEQGAVARGILRGALDCIPTLGPPVGTIVDSDSYGYPGLAIIFSSGSANPQDGGNDRGAFNLIGPW
jgi:hypothetical protein